MSDGAEDVDELGRRVVGDGNAEVFGEAVSATKAAVDTIHNTVEAVLAINQVAGEVREAVEQQTQATTTIAGHVGEAACGAKSVTSSVNSAIEALGVSRQHPQRNSNDALGVAPG